MTDDCPSQPSAATVPSIERLSLDGSSSRHYRDEDDALRDNPDLTKLGIRALLKSGEAHGVFLFKYTVRRLCNWLDSTQ